MFIFFKNCVLVLSGREQGKLLYSAEQRNLRKLDANRNTPNIYYGKKNQIMCGPGAIVKLKKKHKRRNRGGWRVADVAERVVSP